MARIAELELKVLYDISRSLGQTLDLDATLQGILAVMGETLSMQRATVTLQDDDTHALVIAAGHGLSDDEAARGVYKLDEGVTGRIFRTAQPFVVPDIHKEPLFLDKTQSRRFEKDTLSFIGVPIVLQNQCVGVLSADRVFDADTSFEEDVRFLTIVAALIAQLVSIHRQVKAREEDLRRENLTLRAKLSKGYQRFFIVGKSAPMSRVQQLIEKVAPTKATVLLLGESGTGKTLTARMIHELSDRARFTFTKVNCASLPETLLESELFGHEKGAFTGATETKIGRFEEAHKGTVFLDEIGEIPANIQLKLLRFLQEREFERVGSTKTRKVDVRIIAATNKQLERAVQEGSFREDLYYRLNVFPITVPPLRDRREDIPALINHFLDKLAKEYHRRLYLSPDALDAMLGYDWPGNVREMENLMERLAIMVEGGTIHCKDIPLPEHCPSPDLPLQGGGEAAGNSSNSGGGGMQSLQSLERDQILAALDRTRWNQTKAAKELGITPRQLGYRMKKYGIARG